MARTTPAGLAWLVNKQRWQLPPHLALLDQHLYDVATGRTRRLMVFMPPRHGKSELVSHHFPAWYLGTHPEHRVILASYEADFAASWGRKARDLLNEWGPTVFGQRVRDDSSAANRWDLHGTSGGMMTAGVGGPITGKGAHLLILDDPVKNEQEAQSAIARQHMWDWYQSTAYTRLEPDGAIILVMTRWHHDDLAGRLLRAAEQGGESWTVLTLPAVCETAGDVLGRQIGDPLWPQRFDAQRLDDIRNTLGHDLWWFALYQQRPTPALGATFQRPWFDRRYIVPPRSAALTIVQAVDSAFKTGVASDYSVIATWASDGVDFYLLDIWRQRVEYPELKRAVKDQAAKWHPTVLLMEDAASGQSAIQELRRETALPIVAVAPVGSKASRADSVSPLFEAGKVLLPEYAPWLADFIEEHVAFPRGAHDDMVDTTSMALARLAQQTHAPSAAFHDSLRSASRPFGRLTESGETSVEGRGGSAFGGAIGRSIGRPQFGR